ncbi:MAG: DUF2791 family P-loop domain-containing protein [Rhodospirillaceae bacterium]|nr:DUF2791 family P-loop domain-containing protein [Rhodospirillaceae bacterium]
MARDLASHIGADLADQKALAARKAIEALRNGVPNREAVRALGSNQPTARRQFSDLLDAAESADSPPNLSQGMLISGDFGAGKSHLLADFEHLALDRGFACSKAPISKETPLYDLGKVYASAMENGRVKERRGRLVEELSRVVKPNTESYTQLYQWAFREMQAGRLHAVFPASLAIYEHALDQELNGDLESFWAGGKIQISKIRKGLREAGEAQAIGKFTAPKAADLPPQRLRFAIELMKASGYKGWVVLLDEIELVGSYSILQRGRSYSELARWMGLALEDRYPGLIVVGAVTDDFANAIISPDGKKKDWDYIRPKLENSARYGGLAASAEKGMQLLMNSCMPLDSPDDVTVRESVEKLQALYRKAYGVTPPPYNAAAGGAGFQGRMRHKVRAAINEWDLHRLRPNYRPDTVIEKTETSYEENIDLERESKEDAE